MVLANAISAIKDSRHQIRHGTIVPRNSEKPIVEGGDKENAIAAARGSRHQKGSIALYLIFAVWVAGAEFVGCRQSAVFDTSSDVAASTSASVHLVQILTGWSPGDSE